MEDHAKVNSVFAPKAGVAEPTYAAASLSHLGQHLGAEVQKANNK